MQDESIFVDALYMLFPSVQCVKRITILARDVFATDHVKIDQAYWSYAYWSYGL